MSDPTDLRQRKDWIQDVQSAMYRDIVALTKLGVFDGQQAARTVLQHYRFHIAIKSDSARGFRRGYVLPGCTQPAVVAEHTGLSRATVNRANTWLHQNYLVTITDNGAVIDPFLFSADDDEQRQKLIADQPRSAPELRDGPKGRTKLAALKMEPKEALKPEVTSHHETLNVSPRDDSQALTSHGATHTIQSLRPSYSSASTSNEPNKSASSLDAALEESEESGEDSGARVGVSADGVSPRPKASQPPSATAARPAGSRRGNQFYVQTKGDYRGNFTRSDKLNEGKRAGKIYDGEVLVELTAEQAQSLWEIDSHSRRKDYILGLVEDARISDDKSDVQDDPDWWDDDLADAAEQFAEAYVRQAGRRSRLTVDDVMARLGTKPKDMLRVMLDIAHNEWEGENEDLADKWLTRLEDLQDLAPAGVFDKKHSASNRRAA